MHDQSPPSKQPIINAPQIVINAIAVLAIIHVVRYFLPEKLQTTVLAWAAFVPARYGVAENGTHYLFPGEPITDVTSIITYGLLHGDSLHLLMNGVWLLAFGTPVAQRLSAGRFLLFSAICSVAGALFYMLLNQGSLVPMIGASAAISGLMGGMGRIISVPTRLGRADDGAVVMMRPDRLAGLADRRLLMFAAVWIGFSILVGATDVMGGTVGVRSIAWEAHLGGFLAGLLLFGLFDRPNQP